MPHSEVESNRPPVSDEPVDYQKRLQDVFRVSPEVTTEQRPKVWAIAQKAVSLLVNPKQQEALQVYAGIIDWRMFGNPNDRLPVGLSIYKGEDGAPVIDRDESLSYLTDGMPDKVRPELGRLGLSAVSEAIGKDFAARQEEIIAIFNDFLKQTAEYQLLKSFDRPEQAPTPQPLNQYWQQVRQSQIEHSVRQQYGYNAGESISPGTQARHELSRRYFRLDDETMPQTDASDNRETGLVKARAYLLPYIRKAFETKDLTFLDIFYENKEVGDLAVKYRANDTGEEDFLEAWDYTDAAGSALSAKISRDPQRLRYISRWFTETAINRIFQPSTRNIDEALESAIGSTIRQFADELSEIFYEANSGYANSTDLLLRSPVADMNPFPPPESNGNGLWANAFDRYTYAMSAEQLGREESTEIGLVEKYGPDNYRTGMRLIMEYYDNPQAPRRNANEDLVITLDYFAEGAIPFIPGYTLVSSDGLRHGFQVDEKGDQYTPCEIAVSEQQRTQLANEYRLIGLNELADVVEQDDTLTVADLVNRIRDASVYYLPDGYYSKTEIPQVLRAESLTDFAELVQNGKLYVQCTGAALFTKFSLDTIFGESSAATVSGKVLRGDRTHISNAGHAQTVFVAEGRQYILDATPPGDSDSDSADMSAYYFEGSYRNRKAPATPHLPVPVTQDSETNQEKSHHEETHEEKLERLLTGFREQAKVAFDVCNDAKLSEYLMRLPSQDPARRAYTLIRQYGLGKVDARELRDRARYIKRCSEITTAIRKKLKIEHYSQGFLEQMRYTMSSLELIDRTKNPKQWEELYDEDLQQEQSIEAQVI